MPAQWICGECGTAYSEPCPCIACGCDTMPDTRHRDNTLHSDSVPADLRGIDRIMRTNKGIER